MRPERQGLRRGESLLWLLACATLLPAGGRADDPQPRAEAGVGVYSESMDTSIVSTHASAGARLPGELDVDLAWGADIISSASVDVITAATDRVDELRNQGTLSLARESVLPDLDLGGSYTFSIERDSYAHVGQVSATQSFLEQNLSLKLAYGLSYNRLGLSDEARSRWRALWVHSLELAVTRLLDADTALTLTYSGGYSDGYHASRYRRVPVTFRGDLRGAEWFEEREPDHRLRHAITLQVERAQGRRLLLDGSYRFYWDDWGVLGHTLSVRAAVELPHDLRVSLRARGSQQSAASFYESLYASQRQYLTRDRRLSPQLTGTVGLALAYDLGPKLGWDRLELRLGADGVFYRYSDYVIPRLDSLGGAGFDRLRHLEGLVLQIQVGVRR